jgi:hypothetical protein
LAKQSKKDEGEEVKRQESRYIKMVKVIKSAKGRIYPCIQAGIQERISLYGSILLL